jgi:PAS domain S-box-containing protein
VGAQWYPEIAGIALALSIGLVALGAWATGGGLEISQLLTRSASLGLFGLIGALFVGGRPSNDENDGFMSEDRSQLLVEKANRRRAEEALEDAQVRFRSIFESSHDGFAYTAFDGRLLEVNSAFERLTGFSRDELCIRTVSDLVASDQIEVDREQRQRLVESGHATEYEVEYNRKDDSRVPVSINAFVVRGRDGTATGLAMIVKDMTQRRETELALRKTAQELHQKNQQLARANELLSAAQRAAARVHRLSVIGQFAATVAHKIGTPLTALSGHVQLLSEDRSLAPHVRNRLEIVESQIERTSSIIQDLLVYARRPDPVWATVDVNGCLKDCFALFQTECGRQKVECLLRLDADSACVRADRQQLQEAFHHLVENALQAMPDGGRLTLSSYHADASPVERGRRIGVDVTDTGTGIDPEHLAQIFQPFFTTKTIGRGTGLGLAIVQETVRAHGGQITVESEPGKGSRFSIFLPLVGESS